MKHHKILNVLAMVALAFAFGAVTASAGAQLWTPANTTTDLWLDAADASTVTESGGDVSQWNDKSGNGRNATQATVANQPTYVTGAQNGNNIINFNGTSDYFDLGTGLDFIAGNNHVSFAVLLNTSYSNLYGAANGSNGSSSLHVGFRNSSSYRMNYWANDYYAPITSNYNAGQYNLLSWDWQIGTSKTVYANAKLEGTTSGAGSPTAMAGGGRIMNVVGQGYMAADLGELIILQGTPSDDTVDQIEGYLAWKWGIEGNLPVDHPYKSAAPVIPEPTALAIVGVLGLAAFSRRRRR